MRDSREGGKGRNERVSPGGVGGFRQGVRGFREGGVGFRGPRGRTEGGGLDRSSYHTPGDPKGSADKISVVIGELERKGEN